MKRLLMASACLVFVSSAISAENAHQIAERICSQWTQQFNAKQMIPMSLETSDVVEVSPQGPASGDALKKSYEDIYKIASDFHCTVDKSKAGSDGHLIWATGTYGFTVATDQGKQPVSGFWGAAYSGMGAETKVEMLTFNQTPAPAK